MASPLLVAKNEQAELCLLPGFANRHGLITGATGTGKTVTLQALAQGLSSIGVPVFMADVKGDLSGLAKPGGASAKVAERLKSLGLEARFAACPVAFWDVYGKSGLPVRATVSDMGPLLLGRMLGLNKTAVDRESAYEKITGRVQESAPPEKPKAAEAPAPNPVSDILFGKTGPRGGKQSQGLFEAMAKSAARTVGSSVGREIVRGILGSILGAGKRRR